MATITEDYVSFETAKLLKEKGFNEQCRDFYRQENGNWLHRNTYEYNYFNLQMPRWKDCYACPTLAMVMKWLRVVHNIHIVIKSVIRTYGDTEYYYELYGTKNKSLCVVCDIYKGESWDSSENACEAAIKYCLENLI